MVEATTRVLAQEGAESLTTNRVAEVAGVSIGSLYQYFPTKQALIAAVIERVLDEDLAQAHAILHGEDALDERVAQLVHWLVGRKASTASLIAELLPLLDELERETQARRLVDTLTEELRILLLATPDAARPDLADPERLEAALFVVSRALRWVVNAAVLERPEIMSEPAFADELIRITRGLFAV